MASLVGQKLGQYEILGELGKGGMAVVYRARQESMGRDVAIKVIASQMADNPDFIARFEREARTIATLQHPHILPVYDYGNVEGQIFLVMRLVDGGSLDHRIRQGAIPIKQAARMLTQISSALSYAHDHGVIHRDLKPNNILLDSKDNPYLTDFGIAKLLQQETKLTATGSVMGTPSYMSPEQWRGEEIDARSDVYALGIMFYEMITGQLPFTGDTPYSLMYQHFDTPLPSPIVVRPDLPKSITDVLQRATAKNRTDRFASAEQFSEAVNDIISGAPTKPALPSDNVNTYIPGMDATAIESAPRTKAGSTKVAPGAGETVSAQPSQSRGLLVPLGLIGAVIAILALVWLLSPKTTPGFEANMTATAIAQNQGFITACVTCSNEELTLTAEMTKNTVVEPTITDEPLATATEMINTPGAAPVNITATPTLAPDEVSTEAVDNAGTDGSPRLVIPVLMLREENTLTVVIPGNRIVNLERFGMQSTTTDGKVITVKLSDIPAFVGLPFERIRTPICFRFKGSERNGASVPARCRQLPANRVFVAELAPSDMFYYDTVAEEPRPIVILRDGEVVGDCPATASECMIDIPVR